MKFQNSNPEEGKSETCGQDRHDEALTHPFS